MVICAECGKEMTEQYQGQNWCEECHTKFHEECKEENGKKYCNDCGSEEDCWNN